MAGLRCMLPRAGDKYVPHTNNNAGNVSHFLNDIPTVLVFYSIDPNGGAPGGSWSQFKHQVCP